MFICGFYYLPDKANFLVSTLLSTLVILMTIGGFIGIREFLVGGKKENTQTPC